MSMASAYIKYLARKRVVKEVLDRARAFSYVDYLKIADGEINWSAATDAQQGQIAILAKKGYPHAVLAGTIEDIDCLMALGRPAKPWTMLTEGVFVFSDAEDAVAFRLLVE